MSASFRIITAISFDDCQRTLTQFVVSNSNNIGTVVNRDKRDFCFELNQPDIKTLVMQYIIYEVRGV